MKIFTRLLSLFCMLCTAQLATAQCPGSTFLDAPLTTINSAAAGDPAIASCSETADCAGLTTEYFIVDLNSTIETLDDTGAVIATGPEILGTAPAGMIDLADFTDGEAACLRVVPICYDLAALQSLVSNMVLGSGCCVVIENNFAGVCQTVSDLGFDAANPPVNLADVTTVINAFNTDDVTGEPLPISVEFFASVADGVNNPATVGVLGFFCGGASSVPIGYCTDQTIGADYELSGPLAIEMTAFAGENTERGNELTWTTSNETNNEYFMIEKSKDGQNYQEIGVVEGAGNSAGELKYSFLDDRVSGELNYYRIASVSYYAQKDYSNIVSLETENSSTMVGIDIRPNPVKSTVNLSFDSDQIGEANIMIIDATGKIMANYNIDVTLGYNELEKDLSELSDGLYMTVIRMGSITATEKFLKL